MKFVIILERATSRAEAIGPFDHVEDAEQYAHEKFGHEITIWRIAKLAPPEGAT